VKVQEIQPKKRAEIATPKKEESFSLDTEEKINKQY